MGFAGDGFWIRITHHDSDPFLNYKSILGKEWRELVPDGEEPEWEEYSLGDWQTTYYGTFYIDISIDPKTHKVLTHPTEYLGREKASHKSQSYSCLKLRVLGKIDCICTEMKKHAILFGRSGKCPTCWGMLSSLRKCPECGGSGTCPRCLGKGRNDTVDDYWFEEKTGILLKSERFIEGRLVNRVRLNRLKPNVLMSDD
ncbi:MAG: hypothetical protein KAR39_06995 [Thermoplasmata archaeon]|nr:hypothetical protein [Thermoplasmata archaeon]